MKKTEEEKTEVKFIYKRKQQNTITKNTAPEREHLLDSENTTGGNRMILAHVRN